MAVLRDARALGSVLGRRGRAGHRRRARRHGVEPDLVPAEHSARGPGRGVPRRQAPAHRPRPVPLRRGGAGRPSPRGSATRAGRCNAVDAYRTVPADRARAGTARPSVAAGRRATLTAPSSVQAYLALRTRRWPLARARTRGLHRAGHRRGGPVGRPGRRARGLGLVADGIVAELVTARPWRRRRRRRLAGDGRATPPVSAVPPRRLPGAPAAAAASHPGAAAAGGRGPALGSTTSSPRCSCGRGWTSRPDRVHAGPVPAHGGLAGGRGQAPGRPGDPRR